MNPQDTQPVKAGLPLLALAVGAFGIGVTEFSPMGLLPVIAEGVNVSIPSAGMLISAYAIGVMVGACLLYTSPSPRDLSTSRMPSSA